MTTTPHQWYGNNAEIRACIDARTACWKRAHELAIADPNVKCDPTTDLHLDDHTDCDYIRTLDRLVKPMLAELEK